MQKRLLNVKELAEYIGISTATIYNWSSERKMPATCIVHLGRSLRFDLIEIEKWLKAQQGRA